MNRRLTPTLWALLGLMAIVAMPVAANASLPSETTKDQRPKTNIGPSGDWPMFGHDPQRTNFNPDETTINAGNVTQLTQRWQRFIGVGSQAPFSAPSVGGGRLFIGSSIASGDNFFAFDAVTGDPLWGENLGYDDDCFLLVGIGSTAAVSGTIVSIGGGDGAYYGLDVTNGDIEWRDPLGAHPDNFAWASPLLAHGRSYYGAASHCFNSFIRGEARAVDLLSGGQQANRYFVPEGTAGASLWNSPALSPDGSKLVVATGNDVSCGANCQHSRAMISMDALTMDIVQSNQQGQPMADADWGTTPLFFSDSQGRTLVGAGHKNGTFFAYDLNNINAGPIWQRNTGTRVGFMSAYDPTYGQGGTLFIPGSRLYAVDPATGADRWPSVANPGGNGNLAIANGLLYFNAGSSLRILNETNGATVHTITPPSAGGAASGPVVANGFVYWYSGGYVNAWSLQGTPGPTNTPTGTPTNVPTVTNTPALPTATPTCSPGGGPYDIAVVYSDDAPPGKLIDYIEAEPDVALVFPIEARFSTPSLTELLNYDVVVVYPNIEYDDPVAMGNVIADYQDAGGIVVAKNSNWWGPPYGMEGRWMTGGYTMFTYPSTPRTSTDTLGAHDPTHPLMQGVITMTAFFRSEVTLTAGASQVAAWTDGLPLVAHKTTNGHTAVGINALLSFPEEGWDGDFGTLIVNAARWLRPGVPCGSVTATITRTPTSTPTQPTNTPSTSTRTATATATRTPICATTWILDPYSNANHTLTAVDVLSSTDAWAVGTDGGLLLSMHWDGTQWSVVPFEPNTGGALNDVDAVSTNDVWAVGSASGTEAIWHWDGSEWSLVYNPFVPNYQSGLTAVVALSSNDAWAVGNASSFNQPSTPLMLHWDGVQWSPVTAPIMGGDSHSMWAIDAVSTDDVWAVGTYSFGPSARTVTMQWDGVSWAIVPSPNYQEYGSHLFGITAVSANNVWAVGAAANPAGQPRSLILHWNGAGWAIVPNPLSETVSLPLSVAAVAPQDVWTVGAIEEPPGSVVRTMSMHWDGAMWRAIPSPNRGLESNFLNSVGISPDRDLFAVGYSTDALGGPSSSLILRADDGLPFTDVFPTDYFYEAVRYLYCRGVVSGYSDNTFRPYNNTTRGQLTKIVVLAEGWPIYTPPTPTFADVPTTDTFYQYIETAYFHGIISGYADGTFRPGNNVTRGQLCKIVVLAEEWPLVNPPTPTFIDVPTTDPFYQHIETAYERQIISGYTCGAGCLEFRPGNPATRGQICKIVYNAVTSP